MIYDKDFLLELDKVREKEVYAKVTALTFQETPITTIEGRITQGSVNVDGDSAVRRTCSLTIVAQNFDYSNYSWGMNTKFKLEVGIKNNINKNYPDIIWFNQGIFIITSFNTSRSATNFSISIQGKDKMCLLNGEVGGSIESSVDFGTIEDVDRYGTIRITKIPIPDIIREAVHHYAGEPYYNIIINDLDAYGLELLEYRYDDPMYLYRDINSPLYDNILINGEKPCTVQGKPEIKKLDDLGPHELEMLVDSLTGTPNPVPVTMEGKNYYVAKVEYGQTAGYRKTDLTFAGDLIANIGESITSILDKIKNMLSDFEYFYNLDGQFVFQKKKSFVNTLWSPVTKADTGVYYDYPELDELPTQAEVGYKCIVDGYIYTYSGEGLWSKGAYVDGKETEQYVESLATSSIYSYMFSGAELITSFSNNPNMLNMRNDYSVWGNRQGTSTQIPVHMRYAIDLKPTYYKNFEGKMFFSDEDEFEKMKAQKKEESLNNVHDRIQNFTLGYEVPSELSRPTKQADGSWSAGWWDIRDWHDYYYALTQTRPAYSMKKYSRNDINGCVLGESLNVQFTSTLPENGHVWLLIQQSDGRFNPQHGRGNPEGNGMNCTLYESVYVNEETGELKTTPVLDENGNKIVEFYMQPYCGCSDTHTYPEFLEGDVKRNGNKVYFYNPDFPNYDSFDDLVNDQIDKEFQEYLDSGMLNFVDWREIIYQMAKDYYKHGQEDDFEIQIANNNGDYYPTGMTGYEQYYTDINGFWRDIYNPELDNKIATKTNEKKDYDAVILTLTEEKYTSAQAKTYVDNQTLVDNLPENLPLFEDMITYQAEEILRLEKLNVSNYQKLAAANSYLTQLQLKYARLKTVLDNNTELSDQAKASIEKYEASKEDYYQEEGYNQYWNKNVYEHPELLNFWFDFIDDGELTNFNVKTVGARPKVVNDTAVKSIYFRETPDVIFISNTNEIDTNTAFRYIQVQDIESMFSISAQGKSAKDRLDELIYSHGYCIESVTINSIPIYYLQPNTRVHLFDERAGLNGDYIVSKITIPLGYNGTMQITATKAAENII